MDVLQPDMPEVVNPLLDSVEWLDNGVVMLQGNRTLINLNLARKYITRGGGGDSHN